MYPYVFVAGPNKHDVLLVSHVSTDREILTPLAEKGSSKLLLVAKACTNRMS
jgi:hypothetical protein